MYIYIWWCNAKVAHHSSSFISHALFLSIPLLSSSLGGKPINIILRNWFLNGTRGTCVVFFVQCPAGVKLAGWSVGDFRSCSRSRLDRAWQKRRAIIVPARVFSFLRERSNRDTFFFIHPTRVAYPGSRKPRGDLCIDSSPVPYYSSTPLG